MRPGFPFSSFNFRLPPKSHQLKSPHSKLHVQPSLDPPQRPPHMILAILNGLPRQAITIACHQMFLILNFLIRKVNRFIDPFSYHNHIANEFKRDYRIKCNKKTWHSVDRYLEYGRNEEQRQHKKHHTAQHYLHIELWIWWFATPLDQITSCGREMGNS